MKSLILGAIILFVASCSLPGEFVFPEVAKIQATYKEFPKLAEAIRGASDLTLYEGLPHQMFEKEQLELELKAKETVIQNEFPFYKRPNPVSKADKKLLREICVNAKSFRPFSGFKGCGGFHPDYSLHWLEGKKVAQIQICFGCHEIRGYCEGVYVYCEINGPAMKQLREVLGRYQSQRPRRKKG